MKKNLGKLEGGLVMDKMDRKEIIRGIEEFKENANKEFPILKIIFFGSRAYGTANKWSDIDVIIVSPGFKNLNFFERGARMYDYWTLDYAVDFLCYTPEEFDKLKKRITIVREALENGVEIK